ncbi:MAG: hypothetical protein K2N64_08260, partial [Anaeroplasmataceae bacterium]|nr:hypothetical protein [Anaeroplasmataceae bacterium]
FLIIFMKKKQRGVQFDERQLKNRGDCFCISFFVLIGCLFLDGMIRTIIEYDWSTYMNGIFTCVIISIAVFVILAIWKDAYTTTDDSKVRLIIISFLLSIINFVMSIIQIVQYGFLENGKIGLSFLNILTGGLLMIVCVNLFVKYRIDKRKDFEDEELKTEIC